MLVQWLMQLPQNCSNLFDEFMKNPEELNRDERFLVLRILKEINHQYPDYSDIKVGDVIMPQSLTSKKWMPDNCQGVNHEVIKLLDKVCEYGFLERDKKMLCYHITRFGIEYLKINL